MKQPRTSRGSNHFRPGFCRVSQALRAMLVLACFGISASRGFAQTVVARAITAEDVQRSIERGIEYLKSQQLADGSWADRPGYSGGVTPLCTLALLQGGSTVDDDAVKRALNYLRSYRPNATYTASLQTMVFCTAEPKVDRLHIARNVRWIESKQYKKGLSSGMWAIHTPRSPDHVDNSMTQMAMLALYEAERVGIAASDETWRLALDFWQRTQNTDGSWGWGPGYPGSGSMTSAGIAAVIIASGRLTAGDATVEGDQVQCCGRGETSDHVKHALGWLERNFAVNRNPGVNYWLSYYLYSLERAGRLTARRFIGEHDWYREGAHLLVNRQLSDGSWPSDLDDEYHGDPRVSTSFSLMFLAKARRPMLLARLHYGQGDDWNQHRRSLYHLLDSAERAWQRPMGYQVVDIDAATVEDLLETPVLFISGRESPEFSPEQVQKLRQYVDRGGFLFAESCCGGKFDQGFRQLMLAMFPEAGTQLRLLPPNHPVWYAEEKVAPDQLRELWGIDVGCRTGVVYSPTDLSCYWELAGPRRGAELPDSVKQRIAAAEAIGLNVLAYATGRAPKYRDPAMPVAGADSSETLPERGTLQVANILHPGGCDAAPGALPNLLRLAGEKLNLSASRKTVEVRLSDPALFRHHLVLMHGRNGFSLTPLERENLRTYLERGGMVFADAICSNQAFADAFIRELQTIFPDKALERIPLTHPLFSSAFGGDDITSVSLRKPQQPSGGQRLAATVQPAEPVLQGLKLGDRYAVVFSPYDVSCALEGHETLECEGYAVADAARIALNVLLYSFHQ